MACAGFSAEIFSWALSGRKKPKGGCFVALGKDGIVHGASLESFAEVASFDFLR